MAHWRAIFVTLLAVSLVRADEKNGEKLDLRTTTCIDRSPVCNSWASYCEKLPEGTFQTHWCPQTCNRCKEGIVLADPNLPAGLGDSSSNEVDTTTPPAATTPVPAASRGASPAATSVAPASSAGSAASAASAAPASTAPKAAAAATGSANASAVNGSLGSTAAGSAATPPADASAAPTSAAPAATGASGSSALPSDGVSAAPNISSNASAGGAPKPAGIPDDVASTPAPPPPPSNEKPYLCQADYRMLPKLNDDNLALALSIYKKVVDDNPKENVAFSPAAIAIALGLLEVGVRGFGGEEVHKAIAPSLNPDEEANAFAALMASLNGEGGQVHEYRYNLANALYADKNFPINEQYSSISTKCFNTSVKTVDFQRKSDATRLSINEWVSENTEFKIRNLFPPAAIDSDDRLVLVNSVYMFGEWAKSFTEGRTYNRLFYPPSNAPGVEVPMMSVEGTFRYYEQPDLQVLGIDYKHRELTMFILLPTNREGLAQFERSLDSKELQRLMNAAQDTKVDVTIPKFVINSRIRLKEALQSVGIKLLFDISSDMTGISKKRDLFVTNAVHHAIIKVAEKGTEPAKSSDTSPHASPDKDAQFFHGDHPFMFAIRRNSDKLLLFLGRVNNGKILDATPGPVPRELL